MDLWAFNPILSFCLLQEKLVPSFLEGEHAEDPPVQNNSHAVSSRSLFFFDNFLQAKSYFHKL